jgi:hypothetical protein
VVTAGPRPIPVLGFAGENDTLTNTTFEPWVGSAPAKEYSYFEFNVPTVDYPLTLRVVTPTLSELSKLYLLAAYENRYPKPSLLQV